MPRKRRPKSKPAKPSQPLNPRRPLSALTEAEYEAWDARTTMAATRAYASYKLLLFAKLTRADPDFPGPPFCARRVCRKHSTCLGEDHVHRLWRGADTGAPPSAPPCIYEHLHRALPLQNPELRAIAEATDSVDASS